MLRISKSMLYPIVIGLAALALIYVFFSMVGPISAKEWAMFDRLYELNEVSVHKSPGGWDLFSLVIFASAIILFSRGFISVTFARPTKASLAGWFKAPLLAVLVPALALDAYLVITWYNDLQLYYHGGTLNGRPFEPMIWPVTLLFVVLIIVFCLGFSLAGGVLACTASKSKG